jgi:choline dehydrogenase-like flavoprotein
MAGWRQGNAGWSYADLLPLFKRAENSHCFSNNEYHGNNGPLHVSYLRSPSPANEAFRAACVEKGIPLNPDYNGASQFGISPAQVTQYNGERWNAARAYLHANADRKNLTVLTRMPRAQGHLRRPDGRRRGAAPRRPGAADPGPQGSDPERRGLRLAAVAHALWHRPEGAPATTRHRRAARPARGGPEPAGPRHLQPELPHPALERHGGRFRARRLGAHQGDLSSGAEERTGWITTCRGPNPTALPRPAATPTTPTSSWPSCPVIVDDHTRKTHLGHGYTLHTTLMRPKSRGSVTLQSADPYQAPAIDPGFFTHPDDMAVAIKGARMGFEILEAKAMAPYRGKRLHPFDVNDDKAMEAFLRATCDTEYHPVGTCKMGPDTDPMAVVDAQLRVRGVQALRVVDASVMPALTTGNTNAPSMVIGEKAADLIRSGA